MEMKIRINKSDVLCSFVIFIQLMWMQYRLLWPSLSGNLYQLIYYMKYIASFGLLIYAVGFHKTTQDKKRLNNYVNIISPILLIMFVIELLALVFSPVVDTYGFSYITRCIAGFLDKIFVLVMLSALWLLKGKKSIDLVTSVLIFDGFLLFIVDAVKNGFMETMQTFQVVFGLAESTSATSALEVHELTFCIGLCFIYYLFFEKKDSKSAKLRIILLAVLLILGNKRIGFGGILFSGLFAFFVHRRGLRRSNVIAIGVAGTVICITYVALLYNGYAMDFLAERDINVMGRDTLYKYFTRRTAFSPGFIGWGVSAVSKSIEDMSRAEVGNMINVRGLHNDILKIYIEYGFLGSIVWYGYNLIGIPLRLFELLGKKDATLYIALAIFAFITYLTDNTENYFVFQVVLFLIPLVAGSKENERMPTRL